ncbi:MAG: Ppx/GppA family phosphatase [Pseudomonadota bacterium]
MSGAKKRAVIDVGSNTCRLVIYETAGGAMLPFFNEKTMAGLGCGLPETGHLSPSGVDKALETFTRFRAILSGLGIDDVQVVATAAVREASDGRTFQARAESVLGQSLLILSGADEGHLSSLGVQSGLPGATGLVADLGGTSLELKPLGQEQGQAQDNVGETFLLGPLARANDKALSLKRRRAITRDILSHSKLLPRKGSKLYAVGGAWRNVAAVHMSLNDYPLGVIHGYGMGPKGLQQVIDAASRAETDTRLRTRLQAIAKRRYETLLHAALVLENLLDLSKCKRLVFSAYGLREGVLAQRLGQCAFEAQAMLDAAALYLRLDDDSLNFGQALGRFLLPITSGLKMAPDLCQLACLMADGGARLHPDHRSDLIFQQTLRAPLPGLSHSERVFVAAALAFRYTYKFELPRALEPLLSASLLHEARILGTAMRLAGVYSGRSAALLGDVRLEADGASLVLGVPTDRSNLISGTVRRRLRQLGDLLGCEVGISPV